MIYLKEVDLSEAERQKEKIINIREQLREEEQKLREMLVSLNLDYYGSSPSNYYKDIKKEYVTEDGYSVKVENGEISIVKKLQDNLTMTWKARFNEKTVFYVPHAFFQYNSGRHIESSISKRKVADKHIDKIKRMEEILEAEQTYNPFSEWSDFYSFTDFYNAKRK